jgi:hypothetical protein
VSYAEFYDSFLQHPILLWAAAIIGLLFALSRRGLSRTARAFCVALAIISLLDAWLTATDIPGIGPLSGAAATLVPLAFILAGDFRYFLFIEIARSDGTIRMSGGTLARASAWTLVVPFASQLVVHALGSDDSRFLYFIYETLFVFVSVGIALLYLPRHSDAVQWTRQVTRFVIGYYALWAAADAIILTTGADVGFLLRVLPNVLYYGGLVPAIAWAAPHAIMRIAGHPGSSSE